MAAAACRSRAEAAVAWWVGGGVAVGGRVRWRGVRAAACSAAVTVHDPCPRRLPRTPVERAHRHVQPAVGAERGARARRTTARPTSPVDLGRLRPAGERAGARHGVADDRVGRRRRVPADRHDQRRGGARLLPHESRRRARPGHRRPWWRRGRTTAAAGHLSGRSAVAGVARRLRSARSGSAAGAAAPTAVGERSGSFTGSSGLRIVSDRVAPSASTSTPDDGAGHVHEQPAVVEHQLGVGATGRAHVVAAALAPAVQHDDLAGSLARHVDLVAEHRRTARLRAAERTDVDAQDVTRRRPARRAEDDGSDAGTRSSGERLRGDHLGVRAVGRRRHVLTGAVADHDTAVEPDQRDALVVRHEHGARPGARDLPVRTLLELLLVVGPVERAQTCRRGRPATARRARPPRRRRAADRPATSARCRPASTDRRCARCRPRGRRRRPCRSPTSTLLAAPGGAWRRPDASSVARSITVISPVRRSSTISVPSSCAISSCASGPLICSRVCGLPDAGLTCTTSPRWSSPSQVSPSDTSTDVREMPCPSAAPASSSTPSSAAPKLADSRPHCRSSV